MSSSRPPRPACETLRKLVEAGRASFPNHAAPPASPCIEGKGGAYALVVTYTGKAANAESYGGGDVGESVLVHVSDSGKIAKSFPWRYENSGLAATTETLDGTADYDGDGVGEALLSSSEWMFEANGTQSASVWRVFGQTIREYPPARAFKIERFKDVDNDGLPDLVTETVFRGIINGCGPDGTEVRFGPDWVAHARPDGTFAWDEVSRAEVLRSCPTEPTSVVPLTPNGVDNNELRRRIACAVAWGAPQERIIRELDSRCPAEKPAQDECAFEGTLPCCVNRDQLARWAAAKVPFQLSRGR